ncbi:uncharacterized protein DS421_6g174180 [Arachis hypogaea]|nr:uncharacterized protein DS421_6g174180 [Arachis hypogaea]
MLMCHLSSLISITVAQLLSHNLPPSLGSGLSTVSGIPLKLIVPFVSSLITISHQSHSRAFPALVVVSGRSSRSRDWSSSLPTSSPSHTQSRAFVVIVVLVAAAGRSSRSQD